MPQIFRILSIDGGGIRGVVAAVMLDHLEKKTGAAISDLFDLIVGTSTGGLLALAAAKPHTDGHPRVTAAAMREVYVSKGRKIFPPVVSFGNIPDLLRDEKYDAKGLEDVLFDVFGTAKLSQALKPVMVTSYDIHRHDPYFFKSHKAVLNAEHDFEMRRVARATSAAPTFFEPVELTAECKHRALVDGGVFANNPALCAFVEAKKFPPANDYILVSLGTGSCVDPLPFHTAKDLCKAEWVLPLMGMVFDGVSDAVDHQLRILMDGDTGPRGYYRFQPSIGPKQAPMDNGDKANVQLLEAITEKYLEQYDVAAAFTYMCRRLQGAAAASGA